MFAILVAGKTAKTQAKKLEAFLKLAQIGYGLPEDTTPFQFLEYLIKGNQLTHVMMFCKLGQYNRLETAFRGVLTFKGDLKKVSVQDLESVKGIGPKTARFFILHSRPNAQIACLDVHILKWLAKETRIGMPKATPSGKKYAEIEQLFLTEASIRGMAPADLDLQIWKSFSQKTLA